MATYSKFKNPIRAGPNHYMAGRGEPPLPTNQGVNQPTGYVRYNDKDDVTSVISLAKSLLVEGKLNAQMPSSQPPASALASLDGGPREQNNMKPTSSYLCSTCKCQLFTNLDIKIHESGPGHDDANHDSRTSAKARRSNRNSIGARKSMQITHRDAESECEVATMIDFKGCQSAKSQFNSENLEKSLPITYVDPVSGLKKCEYRCYNIFTHKLSNMIETDQRYGFLYCPNHECGVKVGIYSLDGQKCQTCLTMVAPAFQWFRSRLTQHRYGEGGNGHLNTAALNQLNGMTAQDSLPLRLGVKPQAGGGYEPRLKTSASNQSLHSTDSRSTKRISHSRNRGINFKSAQRIGTAGNNRKFGELMIVKERPPLQERQKQARKQSKENVKNRI